MADKKFNTDTNVIPLCSAYRVPDYQHNRTLLAPFATEFAYLSRLKYSFYDRKQGTNMRLDSYCGA